MAGAKKKKKNGTVKKNSLLFLCVSGGLLVAALAICTVLLIGNSRGASDDRVFSLGVALDGVKVGGVDISGMTKEEALSATSQIPGALLADASVTLDVNGEAHTYAAEELGIGTDYEDVLDKAMAYGRTGTFDDRLKAAEDAKDGGADFAVSLAADEAGVSGALSIVKMELDQLPLDATALFTPWGHYADGTPYTPDMNEIITLASKGKTISWPENLVRLTEAEMPLALRYQYWENDHYEEDYTPAAATISRFYYTPEQTGITTDMDPVATQILEEVQSGAFSVIEVPFEITQPAVTLEQIKTQTHLITSWTSSYSEHYSTNRNWNVAKMSGVICGVQIDPGIEWSINEQAGPRTVAKGWALASGITDGAYVDQPGGGVCQISSTLYNAAIRAGLTTQSKHHSIVSGYMPKGLDATISTGGPDLKLTNTHSSPIYIVSYMNPETKTVTVEIYGPPVIDSATGEEVIYSFKSGSASTYGTPKMQMFYGYTALPDGTPIAVGEAKVYSQNQMGMKVTTYRQFYKLDGTKYNEVEFESVNIGPTNGKTYCNYQDPATATPTPAPSVSTSPSVSPSASASTETTE